MGGKQGVLVEQFHQLFHLVLHCSTGQYYKSRYSICLHTILSSTKKCSIRNLSCSSCGEASKKIMKIPLRWNIYHNTTIWQNYSTLDSTREFSMYEVPKTEPRYVHTQHTQQQTFSHHHVFFHHGSALS